MPVYEYECVRCGGRVEAIQQFSEAPLKKHNGCGGRLKRLLSAPAIQFKGSGWYVTDYARKGAAEGKKEAGAESKAESKTESKPAADSGSTAKEDGAKPAKTKKS